MSGRWTRSARVAAMAQPKVKGLTVDEEKLLLVTVIPPSNNHAYVNKRRGGGRALAPRAKLYKDEVVQYLMTKRARFKAPKPPYEAHVGIHFPPDKEGDANNFDKLVVDAIFTHLQVDDTMLYDISHHKFTEADYPCLMLVLRHTDRQLKSTIKEIA